MPLNLKHFRIRICVRVPTQPPNCSKGYTLYTAKVIDLIRLGLLNTRKTCDKTESYPNCIPIVSQLPADIGSRFKGWCPYWLKLKYLAQGDFEFAYTYSHISKLLVRSHSQLDTMRNLGLVTPKAYFKLYDLWL